MALSKYEPKAVDIREEIRNYIRHERDPIVIKWKCLTESLGREERRRDEFVRRKIREDNEQWPIVIRKFVGTLRKAVHGTMKVKGGTPHSIIRSLFLYWDQDKSGCLNFVELENVMKSLGCSIDKDDLEAIIKFYDSGKGENEMAYNLLLNDIGRGEPTLTEMTSTVDDQPGKESIRFKSLNDDWAVMPQIVTDYLEACRDFIAKRLIAVGGTPQEHMLAMFSKYDKEVKGGLTAEQLKVGTRQYLKLQMNDHQANVIIKYYDRKLLHYMEPTLILFDICSGIKSMLHFSELSAKQISQQKRRQRNNPFTVQEHITKPNKSLEKFKVNALKVLDTKVNAMGGSKRGWLREAFRFWDPRDLGYLTHYTHLQGAVKRIGLLLSEEDAHCIMSEFDIHGNGTLDYNILIKDVVASDPHFLHDATTVDVESSGTLEHAGVSVSSRAPKPAMRGIERFRMAALAYSRKSQGKIEPRDVLYGTFLRFDTQQCGRINEKGVRDVCSALGIRLKEHDLQTFITWFDTNGSDCLDYNELVRELFGDDILTRSSSYNTSLLSSSMMSSSLPMVMSPVHDAKQRMKMLATLKMNTETSPLQLGHGSSAISSMAYGCASENRGPGQGIGQYKPGGNYVLNPLNVSSPSKKSTSNTINNKNQLVLKSSFSSSSLKDHGLSTSSSSLSSSPTYNAVNNVDMSPVRETRPMGLGLKTLERNLEKIEKLAAVQARKNLRQQQILDVKSAIEMKLESIDRQRKTILEDHKIAQAQKLRKAMEEERSEEHRLLRKKTQELNK